MTEPVFDVAVVGAGVVGAAAALEFARRGRRVALLDPEEPGLGCSFGNAGLIALDHVVPLANPDTLAGAAAMLTHPLGPLRLNWTRLPALAPWLWLFARASMPWRAQAHGDALASLVTHAGAAWQRWLGRGVAAALHRDIGALYVYESAQALRRARRTTRAYDHYGVRYLELDGDALRRDHLPGIAPHVRHARYLPDMASVLDPHGVVRAFVDAATCGGAVLLRRSAVRVRPGAETVDIVDRQHRTLRARAAVLCAGVDTAALLGELGWRLPLLRERGYHVELRAGNDAGTPSLPVSFVERGFTCTPMRHAIRLAGTVELGAGEPHWARADILARHYAELFPGNRAEVTSRWFGDRPTLPDYLPAIGAVPGAPGVFVATGHQHLGLTLAPLSAELVADAVDARPGRLDLRPFDPARFARRQRPPR